jgi:hypothetical protein
MMKNKKIIKAYFPYPLNHSVMTLDGEIMPYGDPDSPPLVDYGPDLSNVIDLENWKREPE